MSLIGNYSVIHKTPGRFLSGTTLSGDRANYNKSGMDRNKFMSLANFSAVPNGYAPGYAFTPAQKAGGLASYKNLTASISTTNLYLVSGINKSSDLSAVISVTNADLSQIVDLIAALSALGDITAADVTLLAHLASDLAATGTITAADLTFLTQYAISAALSGGIVLTDAAIGAIVDLVSALSATGVFSNAADFATANISADISSQTPLSPETLAASLWNAVAADFNDSGTMGEKMNDAGSASNPWTEVIESGYSAAEILRILLAVAAGKTDISAGPIVKFRNVDDTLDRVVATMTGSERTTVTLDGT